MGNKSLLLLHSFEDSRAGRKTTMRRRRPFGPPAVVFRLLVVVFVVVVVVLVVHAAVALHANAVPAGAPAVVALHPPNP